MNTEINPKWRKRRSALKRYAMIISVFGVLLCCARFSAAASVSSQQNLPETTTSPQVSFAEAPTTLQDKKNPQDELLDKTDGSSELDLQRTLSNFLAFISSIIEQFMTIVSGVSVIWSSSEEAATSDSDICRTKGCADTAKTYLKYMDQSVDYCENFYKFACGGFLKTTVIPADREKVNAFTLVRDGLEDQLRMSIEAPIQPNEPKPIRLVKNFYKSCMNRDEIEAKSVESLRKILSKLGGWPVIDGDRWKNDNFDWKNSILQIRDAGYETSYLITMYVFPDLKNSARQSIYIDQQGFGLSYKYLIKGFDDKIVQAYYNYMVDIAVILGAPRDRAATDLKEALLFELKLCSISKSLRERFNATVYYNPMTVAELRKTYSTIPWKEYFAKLLPSNDVIAEDEIVVVANPSYLVDLVKLMAETPKRIQANYVMWRIVADSVNYMNDAIRDRELEYSTVLNGVTEREPRWKECMDDVTGHMSVSVGAMYVRSYFNEEAKSNVAAMFIDIRKQLVKILQQIEWMDENTRASALAKLAAMSSIVAYSDEFSDDEKLEKHYGNLELSGGNYLESYLNYSSFHIEEQFSQLHKPVADNDWTNQDPTAVNAYYSVTDNSIRLPAGILQNVFFRNDRPRYTNYGAMGFIVGHEITHGFDDVGNQFDENGNIDDWWAQSTKDSFVERTKCMIQQYGNYTVEEVGLNLNGERIVTEMIADNGGIKQAYLAYNDWAENHAPEQRLPELPYTPKQLFWVSAAVPYCTKYTPNALRNIVETDSHGPNEHRIIGAFSNMPEFSKDFNCPIGSKMNPVNKCSVW